MNAVKIISRPPGEAPENIRDAWIGLVLPLAIPGKRIYRNGGGVISGPKNFFTSMLWLLFGPRTTTEGYLVESATAIAILDHANPRAAQWWKENTPRFLVPRRLWIFAAESCEETETTVWPPSPK